MIHVIKGLVLIFSNLVAYEDLKGLGISNCSPNGKQLFIKQFIVPTLEAGLIERAHPENPHHPSAEILSEGVGIGGAEAVEGRDTITRDNSA